MGSGVRYRITTPTVAVVQEDHRGVTQMLPAGAIIVIDDGVAVSGMENALVSAMWEDHAITMFAADVRDRAERIS